MLIIDGSLGEGGGQIVRTSLALSLCLNKPFQIKNIRIKRRKPGLGWQHLAAVKAAAQIGRADIQGAAHGSTELSFIPKTIQGGHYRFDIGTAGSTSLVLQTILPALVLAKQSSSLVLTGGTHNPLSPSYDFIAKAFLPVINSMGPTIHAELIRPGFLPRGEGKVKIAIQPVTKLQPIHINERGTLSCITVSARVAGLPLHIAQREADTLRDKLNLTREDCKLEELAAEYGPGNVVIVEVQSEHLCEVFTAYGQRGVPAEVVASRIAEEVRCYLSAGVPVAQHLADQLLLPMALAGSGSFVTLKPSPHFLTNMEVIKQFMPVEFDIAEQAADQYLISVKAN